MSRLVGIDLRDNHVRAVALRTGYRKLELDGMVEELIAGHPTLIAAIQACIGRLPPGGFDTVVGGVDGATCFCHRMSLPQSARKRLNELLPFELEAVIPLEVDELLIDHQILPPPAIVAGADPSLAKSAEIDVLCVATRIDPVKAAIELFRDALNHQPERVGCNPAELGQLAQLIPELKQERPVALVDFGFTSVDVCILDRGATAMVRTFSPGVENFPDDAAACKARLRQTLDAFSTTSGQNVEVLYILGEGASMPGLSEYLESSLEIQIQPLPQLVMDGLDKPDSERLPQFARAFGMAIHALKGRGIDLRQGELSFERGYEHVKARAPLSAALVAAVLLSFLFSVWAESRALAHERDALLVSLQEVTQSTFGKGTDDPDEAEVELQKARKVRPDDPMPYLDGFGAAVALAEKLPDDMKHDIEEFDFSKGKLKLRGQVDSADDAQKVTKVLGEHRCIRNPKVTKITQVVNSERERYVLEAEIACPEDSSATGKGKKSSGGGQ